MHEISRSTRVIAFDDDAVSVTILTFCIAAYELLFETATLIGRMMMVPVYSRADRTR